MVRTKGSLNRNYNYKVIVVNENGNDEIEWYRTLNDISKHTKLSISTITRKLKDNLLSFKIRNKTYEISRVYKPRYKLVEIMPETHLNITNVME